MICKPDSTLLVVGHGSTVNADSSTPTIQHVWNIRERAIFGQVLDCYWKEQPSLRDIRWMVETEEVYVVPNFISEGYFTQTVIPRELQLKGKITKQDGRLWKYCKPAGSHPKMTELLLARAHEVAPDVSPEETSLLIVGHGTGLNDNSAVAAKEQAARLRATTRYHTVLNAYMEEPPLVADWASLTTTPNVVIVPFFISDGLHSYEDIPVLLGIHTESQGPAFEQEVFRRNPYELLGRHLYYASAIGTEPRFADIILDQVTAFDEEHATVLAAR